MLTINTKVAGFISNNLLILIARPLIPPEAMLFAKKRLLKPTAMIKVPMVTRKNSLNRCIISSTKNNSILLSIILLVASRLY
jgi:hypothetical protein